MKRLAVLISLVALSSFTFAAPVLAVAPTNDDASSPIVIGSLPFTPPPLDTTEATGDPSDDQDCFPFGFLQDASVWYAFTTGADPSTLIADTAASDYQTTITVMTGSPAGPIVFCGFGFAAFPAEPNTTYYFMVAACRNGVALAAVGCDPSATGGSLVFSLDEGPPPPEVDVTVNPVGQFNKVTGSATISGMVTCTGEGEFGSIQVQLTQTVGRFTITGFGFSEAGFVCDGTTQLWSAEVFGFSGLFKGGRAASVTDAVACGEFACGFDSEQRIVRLRG